VIHDGNEDGEGEGREEKKCCCKWTNADGLRKEGIKKTKNSTSLSIMVEAQPVVEYQVGPSPP